MHPPYGRRGDAHQSVHIERQGRRGGEEKKDRVQECVRHMKGKKVG